MPAPNAETLPETHGVCQYSQSSHQLCKHLTWTWLGGSHTYPRIHAQAGSTPSFGCCVHYVPFAGDWPILIPFAPTWGFFKRINSRQDPQVDLWDTTHSISITEKCSSEKRTGLLRTPGFESWLCGLNRDAPPPSLSRKMAIFNRIMCTKMFVRAFCKQQGDELAYLKGARELAHCAPLNWKITHADSQQPVTADSFTQLLWSWS